MLFRSNSVIEDDVNSKSLVVFSGTPKARVVYRNLNNNIINALPALEEGQRTVNLLPASTSNPASLDLVPATASLLPELPSIEDDVTNDVKCEKGGISENKSITVQINPKSVILDPIDAQSTNFVNNVVPSTNNNNKRSSNYTTVYAGSTSASNFSGLMSGDFMFGFPKRILHQLKIM